MIKVAIFTSLGENCIPKMFLGKVGSGEDTRLELAKLIEDLPYTDCGEKSVNSLKRDLAEGKLEYIKLHNSVDSSIVFYYMREGVIKSIHVFSLDKNKTWKVGNTNGVEYIELLGDSESSILEGDEWLDSELTVEELDLLIKDYRKFLTVNGLFGSGLSEEDATHVKMVENILEKLEIQRNLLQDE